MANREGVTFTPEEQSALREAYEGGVSVATLRKQHHTSDRRIKEAILAAGGSLRGLSARSAMSWDNRRTKRRGLEDTARDDVTLRYLRGESLRSIAAAYGTSHPAVLSALRRWGVRD